MPPEALWKFDEFANSQKVEDYTGNGHELMVHRRTVWDTAIATNYSGSTPVKQFTNDDQGDSVTIGAQAAGRTILLAVQTMVNSNDAASAPVVSTPSGFTLVQNSTHSWAPDPPQAWSLLHARVQLFKRVVPSGDAATTYTLTATGTGDIYSFYAVTPEGWTVHDQEMTFGTYESPSVVEIPGLGGAFANRIHESIPFNPFTAGTLANYVGNLVESVPRGHPSGFPGPEYAIDQSLVSTWAALGEELPASMGHFQNMAILDYFPITALTFVVQPTEDPEDVVEGGRFYDVVFGGTPSPACPDSALWAGEGGAYFAAFGEFYYEAFIGTTMMHNWLREDIYDPILIGHTGSWSLEIIAKTGGFDFRTQNTIEGGPDEDDDLFQASDFSLLSVSSGVTFYGNATFLDYDDFGDPGCWHQWVVTYTSAADSGTTYGVSRLYCDGTLRETRNFVTAPKPFLNPLVLRGTSAPGGFSVAGAAIYKEALSLETIAAHKTELCYLCGQFLLHAKAKTTRVAGSSLREQSGIALTKNLFIGAVHEHDSTTPDGIPPGETPVPPVDRSRVANTLIRGDLQEHKGGRR